MTFPGSNRARITVAVGAAVLAVPGVILGAALADSNAKPIGTPQAITVDDAAGSVVVPKAIASDLDPSSLEVIARTPDGMALLEAAGNSPDTPACLVLLDDATSGKASVGCAPRGTKNPRVFTRSDGNGNRRGIIYTVSPESFARPTSPQSATLTRLVDASGAATRAMYFAVSGSADFTVEMANPDGTSSVADIPRDPTPAEVAAAVARNGAVTP